MQRDLQALRNYYSSPAWAAKRAERLNIDGFKCARCGFTRALEVHHINYDRFGHEDVSRDLITLCKKCHKEIEAQKKELNPIQIEHHSVYLAGKISPHDWRNKFCNYRNVPDDPEDIARGYIAHVDDNLSITGPFFISCDHGCYHGDGSHGVGAVNGGCMSVHYTREEVFSICKRQIDGAEILFAYINSNDCYGTLAEIGYAHAMGKDIVIAFSDEKLKTKMWFVDKMQHRTGNISDKWIEEQLTSKFIFKEDN